MAELYPFIKKQDNEVYKALQGEEKRQAEGIELIPSENYVSKAVREANASNLTNKYSEGYPGKRYYGGQEYTDIVENIARDRAKDVSVQTSLSGLRAAAELYAGSHSNKYQSGTTAVSACNATNTMFLDTTDGNGKGLIDAVSKTINGTAGTYTHSTLGITVVCTINAVGDAWAVSARLPSNPSTNPFFCVDSDGKAQTQSAAHATTNFACL